MHRSFLFSNGDELGEIMVFRAFGKWKFMDIYGFAGPRSRAAQAVLLTTYIQYIYTDDDKKLYIHGVSLVSHILSIVCLKAGLGV